jgi:hypothetical protein
MRYYFDIHNSIGFVEDEEGRDLPDLETARTEALKGIRSILGEDVQKGVVDLQGRLEIRDGDGVILTIPFAEAVEIR